MPLIVSGRADRGRNPTKSATMTRENESGPLENAGEAGEESTTPARTRREPGSVDGTALPKAPETGPGAAGDPDPGMVSIGGQGRCRAPGGSLDSQYDAQDGPNPAAAIAPVQRAVRSVPASSDVAELLHGVPLGHSAHPLLVQLPTGALAGAVLLGAAGFAGGHLSSRLASAPTTSRQRRTWSGPGGSTLRRCRGFPSGGCTNGCWDRCRCCPGVGVPKSP